MTLSGGVVTCDGGSAGNVFCFSLFPQVRRRMVTRSGR